MARCWVLLGVACVGLMLLLSLLCISRSKQRVKVGGWLLLSEVGAEERKFERDNTRCLWELVRMH